MIPGQGRFRVEGIHLRGASIHKEMDDSLGLTRKMRPTRGERIQGPGRLGLRKQAGQRQSTHPHPAFPEEIAPGVELMLQLRLVMTLHDPVFGLGH